MKDKAGEFIYIGKASSLKKRILSYFQKSDHDPKTKSLVSNIDDIEWIVTDSEIEALLLEQSLIKKHKPKYNIRLKDDKRYPYIAVTLNEEYPRVVLTRKLIDNGSRYFGPFADSGAARSVISTVNNIFKLKRCSSPVSPGSEKRPCLNYQIERCNGLCSGGMSRDEYRAIIDSVLCFLGGRIDPVISGMRSIMKNHSDSMNYERAADVRDMINNIKKTMESQKVSIPIGADQDFIGLYCEKDEAIAVIFEFRQGVLLSRKISVIENTVLASPGDMLKACILSRYRDDSPSKIIVSHEAADAKDLEMYLSGISGLKVDVRLPAGKEEKGIMGLLNKNMEVIAVDRNAGRIYKDFDAGLSEMKERLGLEKEPNEIECFDISNLQGSDAVASMARFKYGIPEKSAYRRYRIRGYDSINDPGMIHEVVSRRLQYLLNEGLPLPDLMVVDGGPSQLSRAMEAARNLSVDIRLISLAKRLEEIYIDPKKPPLLFDRRSPALRILQSIRDEAHRFAINYHKKLRARRIKASELDEIGISPRIKKILLLNFKSLEGIRAASLNELKSLNGIGYKTAEKIFNYFNA